MTPFDDDKPFRLVIRITKGDDKGKVLERMSQGTCIAYAHESDANKAADEFKALANIIEGKFSSYGIIAVVNEKDNTTFYHVNL